MKILFLVSAVFLIVAKIFSKKNKTTQSIKMDYDKKTRDFESKNPEVSNNKESILEELNRYRHLN